MRTDHIDRMNKSLEITKRIVDETLELIDRDIERLERDVESTKGTIDSLKTRVDRLRHYNEETLEVIDQLSSERQRLAEYRIQVGQLASTEGPPNGPPHPVDNVEYVERSIESIVGGLRQEEDQLPNPENRKPFGAK